MSEKSTPSTRFDGFTNDWELRQASHNVPAVRFRADDGSDFPAWISRSLSDYVKRVTRKNNDQSDIPLTISSLDGLVDQRSYFHKTVASKDLSNYLLLKRGEFAYNKSYSVGFPFGSIKRLENFDQGALSTLYICFALTDEKLVNSEFLKHYWDSQRWVPEVSTICAEGARNHGLLNVSSSDFFEISTILPISLLEQKKIAAFLSAIDSTVDLCQRKLDLLTQAKKALMQQIFSQKLRFKADDGSDFPEWEKKKLRDILQQYKEMASKDGTYPHVSLTKEGVVAKTERYNRDFLVRQRDKQYRVTHKDDICYNPANLKFGVICRNKYGDGIFSPIYITYRVSKGNIPQFVEALVTREDFIGRALRFQEGTVYERMAVSPEDFEKMKVQLPSLPEQQKIASCLSSADALIEQAHAELEQWQEVKKSLLQQMFV